MEDELLKEKPDLVIFYGYTNSTLAGTLAPYAFCHVDAGLRSFDRTMPEEINRDVTNHVSELLFYPTETAVKNLHPKGSHWACTLSGISRSMPWCSIIRAFGQIKMPVVFAFHPRTRK